MLYLIDGYNLLFKFFHSEKKFETQRNLIIDFLKEKSSILKLKIHLVFDGYKQNQEIPSFCYFDNLKVIYTAKNQTADDYILEQLFLSKTPQKIIVVTSDNSLILKAKERHAQIKSIDSFIDFLSKKENAIQETDQESKDFEDTKKNIERLAKIFEERMNNDSQN